MCQYKDEYDQYSPFIRFYWFSGRRNTGGGGGSDSDGEDDFYKASKKQITTNKRKRKEGYDWGEQLAAERRREEVRGCRILCVVFCVSYFCFFGGD